MIEGMNGKRIYLEDGKDDAWGNDAGGDDAVGDVDEAGDDFLAGDIFRDWENNDWACCDSPVSTGDDDLAGLQFTTIRSTSLRLHIHLVNYLVFLSWILWESLSRVISPVLWSMISTQSLA